MRNGSTTDMTYGGILDVDMYLVFIVSILFHFAGYISSEDGGKNTQHKGEMICRMRLAAMTPI